MSSHALEIYTCPNCGEYPVRFIVKLNPKETTEKNCPKCGYKFLQFEKVYACDKDGRVTE